MQWIALQDDKRPITASEAIKHKRYICPQCFSSVQLRSGPHRREHFYHIQSIRDCSLHKKSAEHLAMQLMLSDQLPAKTGCIERPFPQIKRIADVAWEQRQIVFEIQCSPIPFEEVKARFEDYRSLGWDIIWILSDEQFNRRKLSAAEAFLRLHTSYFFRHKRLIPIVKNKGAFTRSNVPLFFTIGIKQKKTKGFYIYDQWEIIRGYRRMVKGPPMPIDPIDLLTHDAQDLPHSEIPECLQERWNAWKWRAGKDLLSQMRDKEISSLLKLADPPLVSLQRLPWCVLIKKSYTRLLNKILIAFSK